MYLIFSLVIKKKSNKYKIIAHHYCANYDRPHCTKINSPISDLLLARHRRHHAEFIDQRQAHIALIRVPSHRHIVPRVHSNRCADWLHFEVGVAPRDRERHNVVESDVERRKVGVGEVDAHDVELN